MPKFKVLQAPPGRWSEGFQVGDILDLDEDAARHGVKIGELERMGDYVSLGEIEDPKMIKEMTPCSELKKLANKKLTEEDIYWLMETYGKTLVGNGSELFLNRLKNFIKNSRKPLLKDDDRVEIVVLITKHDRDIALKCIGGIFNGVGYPFKLTVYENTGNGQNTSKFWNKFVNESTCGYILFIDSDALPKKGDFVSQMVDVFKNKKDAMMVGTLGRIGIPWQQHAEHVIINKPVKTDQDLSGYCFMVKKDRIKEFGMFDEDFNFYGQDCDFTRRIRESKYNMYLVPAEVDHGSDNRASVTAFRYQAQGLFDKETDHIYSSYLWQIKEALRKLRT